MSSDISLEEMNDLLLANHRAIRNLQADLEKSKEVNDELEQEFVMNQKFVEKEKRKLQKQLLKHKSIGDYQKYSKSIIKEGTDILTPEYGDTIMLHMVGEVNGVVFESTRTFGLKPIQKQLMKETFIPGLMKCILGMKLGERCKVSIPPSMRGSGAFTKTSIPSDASLEYDIELLAIDKSHSKRHVDDYSEE